MALNGLICAEVPLRIYSLTHFPDGPGLAGTRMSPFWILLELRVMEVMVTTVAIRHAKFQSNHHVNKPIPNFLHVLCVLLQYFLHFYIPVNIV